jgi:hypothetical protein
MVKLKLTLKSKRPSTVYASNGKAYRLNPGSNVLNLNYEDYLALAKSLGIKPAEKQNDADQTKHEEHNKVEQAPESPKESEESVKEDSVNKVYEEPEENKEVKNETLLEDNNADYSTWSYTKLKAEYKAITGKMCKLKKEDVIAFLQEHNSNA